MDPSQIGDEHRCCPHQEKRVNIDHRAGEGDQCDPEQTDSRSGSKSPGRYFRRPGYKSVALAGRPGTPEYERAYLAALAGEMTKKSGVGEGRIVPGTVRAAVEGYLKSSAFAALASETQKSRRYIVLAFCEREDKKGNKYGDKLVKTIGWQHVDKLIADMQDRPGAAYNLRNALRGLFQYCMKAKLRSDDPTQGVALPPKKSGKGWHSWTDAEIAMFEKAYPVGTRQRLALGLAIYTLQRCETIARLGPQHVLMQRLLARPTKTRNTSGVELSLRLHSELVRLLDATRANGATFLVTENGRSFTPHNLSVWFRLACHKVVGLEHCSIHGLRKAGCRRLIENGASLKQVASLTGHKSLRSLQIYLEDAGQMILADDAMDIMEREYPARTKSGTASGKPGRGFAKSI
jgi:site-specific recombinase XerD